MKNRRYISILAFFTALGFFVGSWACSSGHKAAKTTPQASPAAREKASNGKNGGGVNPDTKQSAPPAQAAVPLPVLEKDDLDGEAESGKNGAQTPDKEEASGLLEEALTAYQDAQAALDRGEIDPALAKLDEAYGLILKANTPPDSDLCQEKNDLRILIAQRIQQLYASHLKTAAGGNGTIPLVENKWVQDEIRSFQTMERRYFEEAYKRSGLYRPMIIEELRKAGLPEHLSWVPIVESGFKVRALSRARALGLWQFIRSTGYRYGLKQDKYVDERMDPVKATRAAVKYLAELHDFFGDWTTALASYNCGELRVQNVIKAQKIDYLDNFWDVFSNLPYETARFVPRIIAIMLIIENPAKYGFTLPTPDPSLAWETVTVGQPVKLASISGTLGLDPLILSFLNPELRFDSTPNYDYALKVPVGYGGRVLAALPALPRYIPPDSVYGWHSVKSGDTLGAIARRYRTSTDAIMRLNSIKNPKSLQIGRKLKIPGKIDPSEPGPGGGPAAAASKTPKGVAYTVKEGDTLFTLARQFNTTVDRIKAANGLDGDTLSVGQKLVISAGRS
ncbi:MAG: LysM peptidoglycan-binding domain-containing protein [Candidatus Aminicenantes bacterium]|nr:LysM peptidoglycan-binding domain-containing protein [Candidatus Aminicenantes bacterium]